VGPLRGGNSKDKAHIQEIRRHFHAQIRELWSREPITPDNNPTSTGAKWLRRAPEAREISHIRNVGAFTFAPLVTANSRLFADLEILFLRPGMPGDVLRNAGDIDNRVKVLIDSLRMPAQPNEMPDGDVPLPEEDPLFCLLEDDKLVSSFLVTTDRLLEPGPLDAKALIVIHVNVRASVLTLDNINVAS
jgi:hypothetical protein